MKPEKENNRLYKLRERIDRKVNKTLEYIILVVIIINIVSLGLETAPNISIAFKRILFWVDQSCLLIFILELILRIIVYNKEFFCYKDKKDNCFHINKWNISDLIIVAVSVFSSLSYFAVFRVFRIFRAAKDIRMLRSLRIVKAFKLVNETASIRTAFRGIFKAIPNIMWALCFLALFTYSYAIIGTNVFAEDFPMSFGNLGTSLLTLCPILPLNAWFSGIARDVIRSHPWACVYFVSYAFISASVTMNVITGIIVDSMKNEHNRQRIKEKQNDTVILAKLSAQISELTRQIAELKAHLEKSNDTP